jgi:DNA-binding beta-propeller fold protein YncE
VQQAQVVEGLHPRSGRYEYVVTRDALAVYPEGSTRLAERVALPALTTVPRGLDVDARAHALYVSYGGQGGTSGTGFLLEYDLLRDRVVWQKAYPVGVDSFALTRDGKAIFMPGGEGEPEPWWYVLRASDGHALTRIEGGPYPHNTVVSLDGRRVYLAPRGDPWLTVVDARTYGVIRKIGPLREGVRPFTINRAQTLAFTTATGYRGFQVSSITSGKVLYTIDFGPVPPDFALTVPSHGISLSPDERQIWVVDRPARAVRVYDVSQLPRRRPREIAVLPVAADGDPPGWVRHTLDGKYVYVGNSGDFFSTNPPQRAGSLPALRETRLYLEIDWRGGRPVATSTRVGLGRRG